MRGRRAAASATLVAAMLRNYGILVCGTGGPAMHRRQFVVLGLTGIWFASRAAIAAPAGDTAAAVPPGLLDGFLALPGARNPSRRPGGTAAAVSPAGAAMAAREANHIPVSPRTTN